MSRSIGVAVIGAGMAGRSHAAGYRTAPTLYGPGLPEVRLVAVADANEALAADTARRYGYQRSESSWQAVAAADDVDVVSVVLANPLHREVVEGLLAAGKHVLCEKPLAPTIEDAEAMVAAAAAVDVSVRRRLHLPAVAGHRGGPRPGALRGDRVPGPLRRPLLVRLRRRPRGSDELALQGRSGLRCAGRHRQPRRRPGRVPVRPRRVGAGRRTLDRRHASGPCRGVPSSATAKAELSDVREPVENEDVVSFTARFASGATATLTASRASFGHANSLGFELFATDGAASFDLDRPGEIQVADRAAGAPTQGTRTVPIGPDHPYVTGGLPMDFPGVGYGQNDLFSFQARAFLEQVAGIEGLPPCPPLSAGLHNLRLLRSVVESADRGGAEVTVGPEPRPPHPPPAPTSVTVS